MSENMAGDCRASLIMAVNAFRLGMEAEACEKLATFVDGFTLLLQGGVALDMGRVNQLLGELFAAQSRKDYLRVADILEYELSPTLFK